MAWYHWLFENARETKQTLPFPRKKDNERQKIERKNGTAI